MESLALLYVLFPDEDTAKNIIHDVIENKLCACTNQWSIQSTYSWEGTIVQGNEIAVLFKTTNACKIALQNAILSAHPYKVPCIIEWNAPCNLSYNQWVHTCVDPNTKD